MASRVLAAAFFALVLVQGIHAQLAQAPASEALPTVEQAPGCDPNFPSPLPLAFAAEDHNRDRRLYDALENGFCGVYTDIVVLDDGKLMVGANTAQAAEINRSLQDEYLRPLATLVANNRGLVYRGARYLGACRSLALYIDVHANPATKLNTTQTFDFLHAGLVGIQAANNGTLFTRFSRNGIAEGPLTAYLSGVRPPAEYVAAIPERLIGLNGNQTIVSANAFDRTVYPFISMSVLGSSTSLLGSSATSITSLTAAQTANVTATVQLAQSQGRKVRLSASPDTVSTWKALANFKPDYIGTEEYSRLRALLMAEVNEYTLFTAANERAVRVGAAPAPAPASGTAARSSSG